MSSSISKMPASHCVASHYYNKTRQPKNENSNPNRYYENIKPKKLREKNTTQPQGGKERERWGEEEEKEEEIIKCTRGRCCGDGRKEHKIRGRCQGKRRIGEKSLERVMRGMLTENASPVHPALRGALAARDPRKSEGPEYFPCDAIAAWSGPKLG